ncbi:MAG: response regulator [Candidatus Falkowbacteria bacterium]
MEKKRILVIEDYGNVQKMFKENLSPYAEVIQAFTLEDAEKEFSDGKFDYIFIDAELGFQENKKVQDTTKLVIKMRKTFSGPMIAISCNDTYNGLLRSSGCDQAVYKGNSLSYAIRLLENAS